MNSNFLLEESIRNNTLSLKSEAEILIDEFFNVVEASINKSGFLCFTIYNPINYSKLKEIGSHNVSHGSFFYNKDREMIRFMIDSKKTRSIDSKHDRLRIRLM